MIVAPNRVLVLYWYEESEESMRAAIEHHLRVLDHSEGALGQPSYCNVFRGIPSNVRFQDFDAVVLHNTLLGLRWSHLFDICKWRLRWLKDSECTKIALPQDEYDHSEILDQWLFELGVSIVFTNFGATHREILYPIMHNKVEFIECLTGYVNEEVAEKFGNKLFAPASRPYDIVYRATNLPFWFGSHGQLKHQIADIVCGRAENHGLRVDISTRPEDTIVGNPWLDFLASGRAVIGCESGSSVLDRRGEVRAQIQRMLRREPGLSFDEVSRRLPKGWDSYRFYAISPRHFEAVITKTCQVLVEGSYGGVFEPDKHYIPLKRDFSNVDEVLEKIKDEDFVHNIVEQAYEDIYLSERYTYRRFAADIHTALRKSRVFHHAAGKTGPESSPKSQDRAFTYPYISVLSALARYYLYPGKAILNKPLKPFLRKCFHFWRSHE